MSEEAPNESEAPTGRVDDAVTGDQRATSSATEQVRFSIPAMDCPSCATTIDRALAGVEGVVDVDTRPGVGQTVVTFDPERITAAALIDRIEQAGYEVPDQETTGDAERSLWRRPRALKTWASGAFLGAGLLVAVVVPGLDDSLLTLAGTPHTVADALFVLGIVAGGEVILREGYHSARTRSLDIDFLMSAAILGAVTASLVFARPLYLEAATLAFLVNVSELLESYSMDRARTSLQELLHLAPEEATVRRSGEDVVVPVEEVTLGETVVVRPGEKVPVDGAVIDGASAVDQSPVTGESVPVEKAPGDEVFAGTINTDGYLAVETTAVAGDDTLSRVIDLVADAEREQTDHEQFVDRFAGYYTPAVVALAILAAVGPPLVVGASWQLWFVRGLTLLVLACPCAFAISTPVSVVSGVTSAANNGVLIKGGRHLEALGEVEAVALDKTGTLTTGELAVTDVIPINGTDRERLLRRALGVEARSEHPLGAAIVAHAEDQVEKPSVEDFESLTGEGVAATIDGTRHYVGKPGLFEQRGVTLSHVHAVTDGGAVATRSRADCERTDCLDLQQESISSLQAAGKTVVLVGTEERLLGVIALADQLRPGARDAVERLHHLGVSEVVMLTGDNDHTAQTVARAVGVDDYHAGLLPEEKVDAVADLTDAYDGVAMVGDGINDAPALARATVGIAMGAAGTDAALETADVALLGDDLSKLPYLRDLAASATGVIRQNIWASLGVKAVLAALVPVGYVPIWLAVLAGDAGMTVGVTTNAMRLSQLKPAT